MKKRILSLLLVLVLLVTVSVFAVEANGGATELATYDNTPEIPADYPEGIAYADAEADADRNKYFYCAACGENVTWKQAILPTTEGGTVEYFTDADTLRDGGHVYVPREGTTVTKQHIVGFSNATGYNAVAGSERSETKLCLFLDGPLTRDLTGITSNVYLLRLYATHVKSGSTYYSLTDKIPDSIPYKVVVNVMGSGHEDAVMRATNDTKKNTAGNVINLSTNATGGADAVEVRNELNIYAGVQIGHGDDANYRGAVAATKKEGDINIYGGRIVGGTASNNGGTVYLTSGSTLTIHDGEIVGGKAANGGAIYAPGNEIVMNGGIITGGKSTTTSSTSYGGGAVYLAGSSTLTMKTGATIQSGEVTGSRYGGNIYIGADAELDMQGGAIVNGATSENHGGNIYNLGTVTMSGDATITGGDAGTEYGGNVYSKGSFDMSGNATITGGSASWGGNVYVADGTFTMDSANAVIEAHKKATYGGGVFNGLSGTFNLKNGQILGAATTNTGAAVHSEGTFTMTDGLIQGGKLTNTSATAKYLMGGAVYIGGGTFTMNAGEITATTEDCNTRFGGAVHMGTGVMSAGANPATFNMNGGEITGGTAENGGAVSVVRGTFNLVSGTITGSTVTGNGGAVYLSSSRVTSEEDKYGSFVMNGENAVIDATPSVDADENKIATAAYGGAVAILGGDFQIGANGGKIIGGKASANGGAVYLANGTGSEEQVIPGTFVMANGTIEKGESDNHGGNVYIQDGCEFVMNGGEILSGKTTGDRANGGNVYVAADSKFTMNNGTVALGNAKYSGGNIALAANTVTKMVEGSIAGGTCGNYGANIYTGASATFTMEGGTLTPVYNEKTYKGVHGDNIGIWGSSSPATIELLGGEIVRGTDDGAVICMGTGVTSTPAVVLGAVTISGESSGMDLTTRDIKAQPKLTVTSDFTSAFSVQIHDDAKTIVDGNMIAEAYGVADGYIKSGSIIFKQDGVCYPVIGEGTRLVFPVFAIIDGVDVIAVPESAAAAMAYELEAGQYIKLYNTVTETLQVTKANTYLDVNGFDVSVNIAGGTLYGMDSATNKYGTDGLTAGKVTVTGGEPVFNNVVELTIDGKTGTRKYLALENNDGTYGFHRYFVGLSEYGLRAQEANAPKMLYGAVFYGDQAVADYMNGNANCDFGIKYNAGAVDVPVSFKTVVGTFQAGMNSFRCEITGMLESKDYAETPVQGKVYVTFADNVDIDNITTANESMKDVLMMAYEHYKNDWLTAPQRQTLVTVDNAYSGTFTGWSLEDDTWAFATLETDTEV